MRSNPFPIDEELLAKVRELPEEKRRALEQFLCAYVKAALTGKLVRLPTDGCND